MKIKDFGKKMFILITFIGVSLYITNPFAVIILIQLLIIYLEVRKKNEKG